MGKIYMINLICEFESVNGGEWDPWRKWPRKETGNGVCIANKLKTKRVASLQESNPSDHMDFSGSHVEKPNPKRKKTFPTTLIDLISLVAFNFDYRDTLLLLYPRSL